MSKPSKTKTCRDCGETKAVSEFYYHQLRKHYMDCCSDCSQKRSVTYQKAKRDAGDYNFLLRSRAAGIRRDCKTRKGGSLEVSPRLGDLLVDAWESQEGNCFYTGLPMVLGTGEYAKNPDYCTVDRIEADRGYVDGNVVLCRSSINRMKSEQSLADWFDFCSMILKRRSTIEQQIKLKG